MDEASKGSDEVDGLEMADRNVFADLVEAFKTTPEVSKTESSKTFTPDEVSVMGNLESFIRIHNDKLDNCSISSKGDASVVDGSPKNSCISLQTSAKNSTDSEKVQSSETSTDLTSHLHVDSSTVSSSLGKASDGEKKNLALGSIDVVTSVGSDNLTSVSNALGSIDVVTSSGIDNLTSVSGDGNMPSEVWLKEVKNQNNEVSSIQENGIEEQETMQNGGNIAVSEVHTDSNKESVKINPEKQQTVEDTEKCSGKINSSLEILKNDEQPRDEHVKSILLVDGQNSTSSEHSENGSDKVDFKTSENVISTIPSGLQQPGKEENVSNIPSGVQQPEKESAISDIPIELQQPEKESAISDVSNRVQQPEKESDASDVSSGIQQPEKESAISDVSSGVQKPEKESAISDVSSGVQQPEKESSISDVSNGVQQSEEKSDASDVSSGTQQPEKESDASDVSSGVQQPEKESAISDVPSGVQQPEKEDAVSDIITGLQQPENEDSVSDNISGLQQPEKEDTVSDVTHWTQQTEKKIWDSSESKSFATQKPDEEAAIKEPGSRGGVTTFQQCNHGIVKPPKPSNEDQVGAEISTPELSKEQDSNMCQSFEKNRPEAIEDTSIENPGLLATTDCAVCIQQCTPTNNDKTPSSQIMEIIAEVPEDPKELIEAREINSTELGSEDEESLSLIIDLPDQQAVKDADTLAKNSACSVEEKIDESVTEKEINTPEVEQKQDTTEDKVTSENSKNVSTIEILEKLEEFQQVIDNQQNNVKSEDIVATKNISTTVGSSSSCEPPVNTHNSGDDQPKSLKKKVDSNSVEEIENLLEEFVRSSSTEKVENVENSSIEIVDNLNGNEMNVNVQKESQGSEFKSEPKKQSEKIVVESDGISKLLQRQTSSSSLESNGKTKISSVKAKTLTDDAWSKIGMKRCSYCIFTTDKQSLLDAHMSGCGKKYTKRENINLKYKGNRYGCQNCLYAVLSRKKFEEHIAFHLRSDPYICLACMITYESKKGIESHVKQKHGSEEMVKCGLRGSKKINSIVDTLHKQGDYSFLGRPLDPKVLLSLVEQKERVKTQQTQMLDDSSEKPQTSTILSVPKVTLPTRCYSNVDGKSTTTITYATPIVTKSISTIQPIVNPPQAQNNNMSKNMIQNPNQIILIPVTMPTCNVVGSAAMVAPGSFALQSPAIQNVSRLVPVTQPRPGQYVNISSTGLMTSNVRPVQRPQLPLLNQPATRFILVPETKQVTPTITSTASNAGNIPSHILGNATSFISTTLAGNVLSTTINLSEDQKTGVQPVGQSTTPRPPPPPYSHVTTKPNILTQNQKNLVQSIQKSFHSIPPKVLPSSSYRIESGTITPSGGSDAGSVMNSNENKSNTATSNQEKLKSGVLATSCVTNSGKKLYFRKSGSLYSCDHCFVETVSESEFNEHIWEHFHKLQKICVKCTDQDYNQKNVCNDVVKVMSGLRGATIPVETETGKRTTDNVEADNQVVFISDDDDDEIVSNSDKVDKITSLQNTDNITPSDTVTSSDTNGGIPVTVQDHDSEKDPSVEDNPLNIKIANTYSLSICCGKTRNEDNNVGTGSGNKLPNEETESENENKQNSTENELSIEAGSLLDITETVDRVVDGCFEMNSSSEQQTERNVAADEGLQIQSTTLVSDNVGLGENSSTEISKDEDCKQPPVIASFYQCGFSDCGFAGETSSEFREHLSTVHVGAEFYKCAHCGHKSYTEDCHCRHMLCHTRPQAGCLFKCCDGCRFGTNILPHFREHLEKLHPDLPSYKCSSCLEMFTTIADLLKHCESNKLQFILCPYCTVKDRNRRVLLKHISSMHPGKPRQITVTSQLVCQEREINAYVAPTIVPSQTAKTVPPSTIEKDKVVVKQEQVEDFNESAVQDVCDNLNDNTNQFDEVNALDIGNTKNVESSMSAGKEIKTDDIIKDDDNVVVSKYAPNSFVRCTKCSYLATGKGVLKKHMITHQRDTEKSYCFKCPICPSGSDNYDRFTRHVNLHEGFHKVKIYICSHCSFQTNIKTKITSHGIKNHNSCVGDIDYATRSLKVKVKAYDCNKCKYLTKYQSQFNAHMLKHKNKEEKTEQAPVDSEKADNIPCPEDIDDKNLGKSGNLLKRFSCSHCDRSFSKLPRLKQHHLSTHFETIDTDICLFRCSYCGFSSTSKAWITEHSYEKHLGKPVRLKRRMESVSPSKQQAQQGRSEMSGDDDVSIDKHHCDCCSFSCSTIENLIKHTKVHLHVPELTSTSKNELHENNIPKKDFVIPAGNVFKEVISCIECPFKTKLRLDLLRHIKSHPNLYPVSACSPRREANPHEKSTKGMLKNQFDVRRLNSNEFSKSVKRRKLLDDDSSDEDFYDPLQKRKQVAVKSTTNVKSQSTKTANQSSLYYLGGDILHFKLKPCYTKDELEPMFECLFCKDVFEDKYSLHKHILMHMEVSFIKCNYCDHNDLEISAMGVHIQKEHKKPIQHSRIPIQLIESKINKSIHDMKAREYWGSPETPQDETIDAESMAHDTLQNTLDENMEDDEPDRCDDTTDIKNLTSEKLGGKPSVKYKIPPCISEEANTYRCKICDYRSSVPCVIIRHAVTHSSVKRQVCPYCEYRSHWKGDVNKHITHRHSNKPVRCLFDDSSPEIDSHYLIITPNDVLDTLSEYKKSVSKPINKEDSAKKIVPKTEKVTNVKESKVLSNRMFRIVGFKYVFKCLLCKVTFKTMYQVFKHLKNSDCNRPMWKCSGCKAFKTDREKVMKDHLKNAHASVTSAKSVVCLRNEKIRKHAIPLREKIEAGSNTKEVGKDEFRKSIATLNLNPQNKFVSRSLLLKKVGNQWVCKKCNYCCQIKNRVVRHLHTHFTFKKYGCSKCSFRAKLEQGVLRHMRVCHPGVKYHVKSFSQDEESAMERPESTPKVVSGVNYKTAIPSVEMDKRYKCLECGIRCYTKSGLYKHIKVKCPKLMTGCSKCDFKDLSKEVVEAHLKSCQSDAATMTLTPNAKIHVCFVAKNNEKNSEFVNQKAKSAFPIVLKGSVKSMKTKSLTEKANQLSSCPECKFPIATCSNFQDHLKGCHRGFRVLCIECNEYVTRYFGRLVHHARIFHNRFRFVDMKFKLISEEQVQIQGLHQKPLSLFKCTKCDRMSEKGSLKNHYFIHYRYKPYECGYCSMITNTRKSIRNHVRNMHSNKKLKFRYNRNEKLEKEIMDLIEANRCQLISRDKRITSPPLMKAGLQLKKEEEEEDETAVKEDTSQQSDVGVGIGGDIDHMFSPSHNYTTNFSSRMRGNVFKCKICPYQTTVMKTITTHFYLHVPHVFKCPYCDFQNYPRSKITNHILKEHPGKTVHVVDLRSKMKNLQFRNFGYTRMQHPGKKVLKRSKEENKSTGISVKKEEEDVYTSEGSDDDDEEECCSVSTESSRDTKKILYCCNMCSQSMDSLYHYRQHLTTHGGFKYQTYGTQIESKLKCGHCSYLAFSDIDFQQHMEFHFSARPFSCPYCTFSQYRPSAIKNHIKYKHPGKAVDVIKDNTSSCLIGGMDQGKKRKLVDFDTNVVLEDIFAMNSEEFEMLLNKAEVSVIDLNFIPDEKFNAVSRTLGLGEKFDKEDHEDDHEDNTLREHQSDDDTEMEFDPLDEEDTTPSLLLPVAECKNEPEYMEMSHEKMVKSEEMMYEDVRDDGIDDNADVDIIEKGKIGATDIKIEPLAENI